MWTFILIYSVSANREGRYHSSEQGGKKTIHVQPGKPQKTTKGRISFCYEPLCSTQDWGMVSGADGHGDAARFLHRNFRVGKVSSWSFPPQLAFSSSVFSVLLFISDLWVAVGVRSHGFWSLFPLQQLMMLHGAPAYILVSVLSRRSSSLSVRWSLWLSTLWAIMAVYNKPWHQQLGTGFTNQKQNLCLAVCKAVHSQLPGQNAFQRRASSAFPLLCPLLANVK